MGNTFKNSKWTNYKIQNIKNSFVNSFSKILFITFILLLIFFNYKQNVLLFAEFIYYTFYLLIKDILCDYVNFTITVILGSVYSVKTYIVNFFIYMLSPNKKSKLVTYKSSRSKQSIKQLYNIVNSSTLFSHFNKNHIDSNYTSIMSSVFKIKNSISWLNLNINIIPRSLINIYFFDSKVVILSYPKQRNISYEFIFKKNSHPKRNRVLLNENTTSSINLNYFKNINNKFLNSTLAENILNSSLNILKQTRWLTRNLMLSDKFIISTNFFTEYKKLIGDNSTLSKLTNNNVWASSNMSKIANIQKTLIGLSSPKIKNFHSKSLVDNFDESRLWIFKKMYFSTIIRHSSVYIDFFLNKIYGGTVIQKNDKIYSEFIKKSLTYNLLFLHNTVGNNYLNKRTNLTKLTTNNFSYNMSDYSLLSDDNVDTLVNSFIICNVESDLFNFYSNLYSRDYEDNINFNLSYKPYKK